MMMNSIGRFTHPSTHKFASRHLFYGEVCKNLVKGGVHTLEESKQMKEDGITMGEGPARDNQQAYLAGKKNDAPELELQIEVNKLAAQHALNRIELEADGN